MDEYINIEYQTETGFWITVGTSLNFGVDIWTAMQRASRLYPNTRVRAVDSDGRTVDVL